MESARRASHDDPIVRESLLLFSDCHLGSDLNDSGPRNPRSVSADRDLADLLAHYRELAPPAPASRWRLIIAGDFVDFVGMSIDPTEEEMERLTTALTEAERAFGLGGAEDFVRVKLARAAARHPEVFQALREFVCAGNALTMLHGNHDTEMHWDMVREDFRVLLSNDDASAKERIDFEPWFVYAKGLVFIEHGHQYDPFCCTPYLLAPLSPLEPDRVLESLSDTLLRYIVRRTPGMKEYGHENRGLWSYITWGLTLGVRGTFKLYLRFWSAVLRLRATARAYSSDTGRRLLRDHHRRLDERAESMGVARECLDSALSLHVTPMALSPRGVLTSVMLDRMATFAVMVPTLIALIALRSAIGPAAPWLIGAVILLWGVLHVHFSRGRPSVDPGEVMVQRSRDIARIFPSSFIVMGHTHAPLAQTISDGTTYINLGAWAEEEPDPEEENPYRSPRTHLVVHANEDCHEAYLLEWLSGEGPREVKAIRANRTL